MRGRGNPADGQYRFIGEKTIFDTVIDGDRATSLLDGLHFAPFGTVGGCALPLGATSLLDGLHFAPQPGLIIVKEMVFINATGGIPTLTFVDQTFSQVPEPGTLAMLAGLAISSGVSRLRLCRRLRSHAGSEKA